MMPNAQCACKWFNVRIIDVSIFNKFLSSLRMYACVSRRVGFLSPTYPKFLAESFKPLSKILTQINKQY